MTDLHSDTGSIVRAIAERSVGLAEMLDQIVNKANGETLVVTANNRIARFIEFEYNRKQAQIYGAKGIRAWESCPILTLAAWTRMLWGEWQLATDCPEENREAIFIGAAQDRMLWELLFKRENLSLPPSAVNNAVAAFRMLNESAVEFDQLQDVIERAEEEMESGGSPEEIGKRPKYIFANLISDTRLNYRTPDGNSLITQAEVLRKLAECDNLPSCVSLPKTVIFAGFDSLLEDSETPDARRRLADRLRKSGVNVKCYVVPDITPYAERNVSVEARTYPSLKFEIGAAGHWARELLMQSDNPGALRIGIVIPELTSLLPMVQSELNGTLFPEALAPENLGKDLTRNRAKVINMSYAMPLSKHPAIMAATATLRLVCATSEASADFDTLSIVLRSPWFFDSDTGPKTRLDLEVKTRDSGCVGFTRTYIKECARHCADSAFLSAIRDLDNRENLEMLGNFDKGMRLPSEWSNVFRAVLNSLRWLRSPSAYEMDKRDAERAHKAMAAQLDALSQYDVFGRDALMSANRALTLLDGQLEEASFQLPGGDHAPVQIMGLLEAAGQQFTHLWVCGMDDSKWPVPPKYNAFLPVALQCKFQMPYCSPQWGYDFANRYTDLLIMQTSTECVFSSPRENSRSEPLRLSALVRAKLSGQTSDSDERNRNTLFEEIGASAQTGGAIETSTITDVVSPIQSGSLLRGGTGIVQSYFRCPFQSYLKTRFSNPKPLSAPSPGINSLTWGNLVHQTLQLCWARIKTGSTLKKLATEHKSHSGNDLSNLATIVLESVQESVRSAQKRNAYDNAFVLARNPGSTLDTFPHNPTGKPTFDLSERLANLVCDWLINVEAERTVDFEVVLLENESVDKNNDALETQDEQPNESADKHENHKTPYRVGNKNGDHFFIHGKIDRVDKVPINTDTGTDAKYIVIDYKTGTGKAAPALVPKMKNGVLRFAEPQMPIYCLGTDDCKYDLTTFANINQANFVGLAKPAMGPLGFKPSRKNRNDKQWDIILEEWEGALAQAAQGILSGVSTVSPDDKTCENCNAMAVCRYYETKFAYGSDDEGENE